MAVITVSRQLGSIGDLVARRASEILSCDFVDKNLITEVAREANVPESEVEKFDEQTHSAVKRFIHSLRTRKEAIELIQKSDRRRSAYLRDNYHINWDDPALYHIVVNTGRTCLESAARIIQHSVSALGRA